MDPITRRQFNQFWAALFAFLAGLRPSEAIASTDNRSYWQHRISDETPDDWKRVEKGLAEEWEAWNDGSRYGREGILQDLMIGTYQLENPKDFDPFLSQRERKIVATVIQWLGTNVGRCFLHEASRRMGPKHTHYPFSNP